MQKRERITLHYNEFVDHQRNANDDDIEYLVYSVDDDIFFDSKRDYDIYNITCKEAYELYEYERKSK